MGGDETVAKTRTPEIMADAAYAVFTSPSRTFTGNFLIDGTRGLRLPRAA
jgi:citronellol/citronellal dehydrogenase